MKRQGIRLLVSLLIAFGIWIYVVTVVSPESEETFYNIPVVLSNESLLSERGLMVTSEETPTVTLRLQGNRSDLTSLKNSDISVVADLSKISEEGEQTLSYTVTFTGTGDAFSIVSSYPEKLTLTVAEWATSSVPVVVNYSGTLAADYMALQDELALEAEYVTVTGPKAQVDQITQAVIDVDLDGQYETISQSYRYTLCDADGEPVDAASIKTNLAEISLILKIQQVKEIPLKLEVTYGGGATAQNSMVILKEESIKVCGSEKLLESLTSLTLGSVSLADYAEDTTLSFDIILPDGVTNLSGITQVTADVTFVDLETKVLNVQNIHVANLPDNMSYVIGSKQVQVTVRGTAEQIAAIEAEDISLWVDLTGAITGEGKYKAQVFIGTGYDTVGAIGSYWVNVALTTGDSE